LPLSIHATIIATVCGRYASFLPAEAIARIFGAVNSLPNLAPSWNVAPTQSAPVVRPHPETAERHLDLLKWGLLPYWMKEPTKASHKSSSIRRPHSASSAVVPFCSQKVGPCPISS
jgi:putative SOS response-associated peptidase YedK